MNEILVSTSFKTFVALVYSSKFDDGEYSTGSLEVFKKRETDEFLLHVDMDCEDQCLREGHSFFYFDNFSSLKDFIISDEDCRAFLSIFSTEKDFELHFTEENFDINIL